MFNIYWSVRDEGWQGHERNVGADTIIQAFSAAAKLVREALSITEIEFLPVGDYDFVVWADGRCKGYVSITEHSPKPKVEGL